MSLLIAILILFIPTLSQATTWSEVVAFIVTAEANNPDCRVWQENFLSEGGAGIRVSKRCNPTDIARNEYWANGGDQRSHGAAWVSKCTGNGANVFKDGTDWGGGQYSMKSVYCDGTAASSPYEGSGYTLSQDCNTETFPQTDCTSADIVVAEWPQVDDDACAITLSSTGSTEHTYINIGANVNGPCECEPKGWIGESVSPDICTYHMVLGDPVPPDTQYGDTVTGTVVTAPIPPGTVGDDGGMTGGTVTGTTTTTTTTTADTTTTTTTDGGTPVVTEATETTTETKTEEKTIQIPSIPYVNPSAFDTSLNVLLGREDSQKKDWGGLIETYIESNPLVMVAQGTHIEIADSSCTVGPAQVFGKDIIIDFCSVQSMLVMLGNFIFGVATMRSIFIALGDG